MSDISIAKDKAFVVVSNADLAMAKILELFSDFKRKGKTVIMITHDQKVAQMAERIIFMKDGKVLDHNYKFPNV